MNASAAWLSDRAILRLEGPAARDFLDGLVTASVTRVTAGEAAFAGLLTPQGKVMADFLVTQAADGALVLDVAQARADWLAQRLDFYRLRAAVTITRIDPAGVLAVWDESGQVETSLLPPGTMAVCRDPRAAALGWRLILSKDEAAAAARSVTATLADQDAYDAHRIACGVPQGGLDAAHADFVYGEVFPHDINMDRLRGVDFDKGCYVGQEVVSRMEHRGTARTRLLRVAIAGATPTPGIPITAGDKPVGTMGTAHGRSGLALMRLDRVAEAQENGVPLRADGATLTLADDPARFARKGG